MAGNKVLQGIGFRQAADFYHRLFVFSDDFYGPFFTAVGVIQGNIYLLGIGTKQSASDGPYHPHRTFNFFVIQKKCGSEERGQGHDCSFKTSQAELKEL